MRSPGKGLAVRVWLLAGLAVLAGSAVASVVGTLRGIVHDPTHRPLSGAVVQIKAVGSSWQKTFTTNDEGEFQAVALPLGRYEVTVRAPGFADLRQQVEVSPDMMQVLHLAMRVLTESENVNVTAALDSVNPESSTTRSMVSQEQILMSPGADRANSMAMITNFVPSAVMTHDMLHVRGGHQVSWMIDGVPVPNTSIASNVGPQFDPKNVDYVDIERGGYSAEYGDRSYGVFNVVPRTGFERDRQAELITNYGGYHTTDDQLNFGSHTSRFAYYGSLGFNRTDLGLQTQTPEALHDRNVGESGFTSLIYNASAADQLRFVGSARNDFYQVPNTPEQQANGMRDTQRERDAFLNFSWMHKIDPALMLTASPFYHYNRADFSGGPNDTPVVPSDDRRSNYAGGVVMLSGTTKRHNFQSGLQGFAERDETLFSLGAPDQAPESSSDAASTMWARSLLASPGLAREESGEGLSERDVEWGQLESLFFEDQFKLTSWLTLNGGLRYTHFSSQMQENAVDPRIGAAVRIPRLGWVARAFYGRYYQSPPLSTVGGPLLDIALQQGFGFLPLKGERDEQREFGLTIPLQEWTLDLSNFETHARNYFDHDVLGNSSIFFPLTIDRARVRGWEANLRSPLIGRLAQFHLAFSNQQVQGKGATTGGLTAFAPPEGDWYYLDHDQRNTLSIGGHINLPKRSWFSSAFNYGSGFLNGDGPAHLPAHQTVDIAMGTSLGERWSLRFTVLNVADNRYLIDNSNTFGGTHYEYPRQISGEVRFRFKY